MLWRSTSSTVRLSKRRTRTPGNPDMPHVGRPRAGLSHCDLADGTGWSRAAAGLRYRSVSSLSLRLSLDQPGGPIGVLRGGNPVPFLGRPPALSPRSTRLVNQSSCVIFVSRGAKQAADQSKIPGQRPASLWWGVHETPQPGSMPAGERCLHRLMRGVSTIPGGRCCPKWVRFAKCREACHRPPATAPPATGHRPTAPPATGHWPPRHRSPTTGPPRHRSPGNRPLATAPPGHRATGHRATRHRATGHRATRHRATGHRATGHRATGPQGTGCRPPGTGHRAPGTGHRARAPGHWATGHRATDPETGLRIRPPRRCRQGDVPVARRRLLGPALRSAECATVGCWPGPGPPRP